MASVSGCWSELRDQTDSRTWAPGWTNVARADPRESLATPLQQCSASMVVTGLGAGTLAPGLREAPDYAPG
jgi:hypothetical protein